MARRSACIPSDQVSACRIRTDQISPYKAAASSLVLASMILSMNTARSFRGPGEAVVIAAFSLQRHRTRRQLNKFEAIAMKNLNMPGQARYQAERPYTTLHATPLSRVLLTMFANFYNPS